MSPDIEEGDLIMNGFNYSYYAKERLLDKMDAYIEEKMPRGVNGQLNAIAAREKRKIIEALNRAQAYKLEKKIIEIEYYDPSKDKWGFGPRTVNAIDYTAFLEDI
jgi:hypothetical protein